MLSTRTPAFPRNKVRLTSAAALVALFVAGPLAASAQAAAVVVPLGTASAFSVLAGSTVTNTGTTTINRSVGVSPGTAITGGSTMTIGGTYHQADAVALDAKNDLTTGYNNAAGQNPRTDPGPELGGQTLVGGVYNRASAMALTGALTLDGGHGDNSHSDSVWVFQAGSTLTTASASSIVLTRGADACNVFWQVGSSATFGTASTFVGTVMADQSITMNTGATLQGRVLARIAAVNLHANVITSPACNTDTGVTDGTTTPTPPVTTPTATPTPKAGGTGGTGGTGTGTTNGGTGGSGGLTTNQIKKTPTGGVDTGVVGTGVNGHPASQTAVVGWTMAVGFAGLTLFAVRRRRRV
jgi:Ice-binding-like